MDEKQSYLSLKLASGEEIEVSVVRFIEESEADTSEDLPDRVEDMSEVDSVGEVSGSHPYSAK